MHLVQILLPVYDANGGRFESRDYEDVAKVLTGKFGGVTAYARAPAMGLWQAHSGKTTRDDIVVYEAMVASLDRVWWAAYRAQLEQRFQQAELVVRAMKVDRL